MIKRREHTHIAKKFFTSPIFLIAALGVSLVFTFAFAKNYIEDYNIRREITLLQEEVQALETKKIESLEMLDYVMSDGFVEETARKELNLKKPGENVLIVKHAEEHKHALEEDIDAQRISKPKKWWYFFTKHTLPDGME